MRTIKAIIPNEKASEFELKLDGLFDADDRISDTNERDFWTVFLIMVKDDAEQSGVDLLEVEFNK